MSPSRGRAPVRWGSMSYSLPHSTMSSLDSDSESEVGDEELQRPHAPPTRTIIRSVVRASRILVHLGEHPDGRTAKEVGLALGSAAADCLSSARDGRRRGTPGEGVPPALSPRLGARSHRRRFRAPVQAAGVLDRAPLHRLAGESGETAWVGTWRPRTHRRPGCDASSGRVRRTRRAYPPRSRVFTILNPHHIS